MQMHFDTCLRKHSSLRASVLSPTSQELPEPCREGGTPSCIHCASHAPDQGQQQAALNGRLHVEISLSTDHHVVAILHMGIDVHSHLVPWVLPIV
jgi:hypothetical protein